MEKCKGLQGKLFGHDWVQLAHENKKYANDNFRSLLAILPTHQAEKYMCANWFVCFRCGAVKVMP